MYNIKYFRFPCDVQKEAYDCVRNDVLATVQKDKRFNTTEEILDLTKLSFYQHIDAPKIRRFQLGYLFDKNVKCVGYGSVIKHSGDFLEYLFLVMADRTTYEMWTYKYDPIKTYLACNSCISFTIHSTWKCRFFNIFKWRIKWDVFCENESLGFIDGNGCVKRDSLNMSRSHANNIPIHLSYPERQFTDVILAPLRLICGDKTKNFSDFVIPKGTELKGEEVLLGFMLNIVFREVFFDLAYPSSSSGV